MRNRPGTIEIFLQPGEYFFGDRHTRIRTVLGSCIAIALWHPQRRIGGMCHYMLPERAQRSGQGPDGRYADEAMHLLMKEIARANSTPEQYVVRMFGGSHMFPNIPTIKTAHVGQRNISAGVRLLNAHGMKCSGVDTGGHLHRHVIFDIHSGEIFVKKPIASLTKTDTAADAQSKASP